MKTILILSIAAIALGSLALLTLYIVRRVQSRVMRKKIASEGFETAMDVLYPHKRRRFHEYKTGPVHL
ncbi:MAG: hypothetical protein JNK14_17725 [Chitinophagaceae bacterium]|nr:hypothetical protein [Chitinophagaceae bacterium]